MLNRRFMLLIVVALSFSALAAANSLPVNSASFHSERGPDSSDHAYSASLANHEVNILPRGFNNAASYRAAGNKLFAIHGTISHKNGDWAVWRQTSPKQLTTPEPGTLLLLSTGLVGVGGMVRRKLNL